MKKFSDELYEACAIGVRCARMGLQVASAFEALQVPRSMGYQKILGKAASGDSAFIHSQGC